MKRKTFKEAFEESLQEQPALGSYIHICRIVAESGMNKREIVKVFNTYMGEDEYEKDEKDELIDYLVKVSNALPNTLIK